LRFEEKIRFEICPPLAEVEVCAVTDGTWYGWKAAAK